MKIAAIIPRAGSQRINEIGRDMAAILTFASPAAVNPPSMTNRLASEISPYLLQHAENPVDWMPWGEAALDRARREDKPIFLSIGYAACHWCHVMAHESFEDEETAALLNQGFVAVKVDREERPDVDAVYMDAVVALTGQGGWPLSAFLTPDGRPFYGGTYFPPLPGRGMPSFREVLVAIRDAWQGDRAHLEETARRLTEHVAQASPLAGGSESLDETAEPRAMEALLRGYDWEYGGWGGAPKFPQAGAIGLLLRRFHLSGDRMALDMAIHALEAMARGGIFDQLGGGFHRYAVDRTWTVPHFEKMLHNALLACLHRRWQLQAGLPSGGQPRQCWLSAARAAHRRRRVQYLARADWWCGGRYYVWVRARRRIRPRRAAPDVCSGGVDTRSMSCAADSPSGSNQTTAGLQRNSNAAGPLDGRPLRRVRPALDDKVITA
jgi:hypothetical protein